MIFLFVIVLTSAIFSKSIPIPTKWIKCAEIVIRHHMRISKVKQPGKVVEFLLELNKEAYHRDG
jgi:hypothetical protein